MRIAPRYLLSHGFLLGGLFLAFPGVHADTVYLKNGNRIEGQIVSGGAQGDTKVVVQVNAAGRVTLRSADVLKIDKAGAGAAQAAAGDYVAVKIAKGSNYYGDGTYYGQVSPESDDQTLVLVVPGAGKIRIPQAQVASKTKIEAAPAAPEAGAPAGEARTIKTTHVLHLKNGRRVSGSVLETPANEPVKLQIGDLGVLFFSRDEVERVEAQEGTVQLPAEPAAGKHAPPAEGEQVAPEVREQLKREVRAELLRELLDTAVEEKLESALQGGVKPGGAFDEELLEGISNEQILAIEDSVRELTRERTRNRVRAERQLKEMGSAALPFLRSLLHHPFNLTRRAVQRIVRDIGDVRGAPLAIEALNDPDEFVRTHAHEAMAKLLPGAEVAYDPAASKRSRIEAQAAYWSSWEEGLRGEARRTLLETLARKRSF